ncbi:diguanylate cyclase domain-containing protein [Roseateles cellulosilyticus]|uniref:diguanylate cyclase n=1 Tax=Pelomonas cellulosilytica TaxID=2906762 RepID=A0ABS8XQF7_9BURK|nr:diguanylate cyclase [Pelomonas sp. P8]MCE4553137.1 diguanylate cyclase [Pelomonas sp. P8]
MPPLPCSDGDADPAPAGGAGVTHVLHVDDSADNRLSTKLILDRPGLEVVSAASAADALARLREHEFALALVDVNMPEIDGFELAEAMRDDPQSREVPIIFLTGASGDAARTFRGYEAGGVDFLVKPVAPRVLESKVQAFVALYLQRKALRDQKDDCERLLRANQRMAAELERAHEAAVHAAFTDELTGIPNRRHILKLAQTALTDPRRHSWPVCFAVLDLDHFKRINDLHGHAGGDAVLRHFCRHTQSLLRAGQAMGRLGGEEFLLLLPGTELTDACTALERVRRSLGALDGIAYTFSAGVAQAQPGDSLDAVLERADRALYLSKSRGRDCTTSELMGL